MARNPQDGLGLLLHEVLHKQMVGGGALHNDPGGDPFLGALRAMGIQGTSTPMWHEHISYQLGRLCF